MIITIQPAADADAANAKTKMENGFDLTNYDERTLAFAKDYANQLLAIDVNLYSAFLYRDSDRRICERASRRSQAGSDR